ncbi:agmatinase family protein [Alkalihalobacillus sp. LMS39]|uniref:agmatinase family protein n=1 Tax=Alkalihalobacillus sp. LMS39 TaxID=2924032 RepID=UPI001FB42D84|nr:agmatinase family protein [Alkalihalobacillus sp. LMS39]UOE93963.1 agmatinase family protein [Alkalihalobacillus sp. LMS39]
MSHYPYPFFQPPAFRWHPTTTITTDAKVHEWIKAIDGEVDWTHFDVGIVGVPLSRSSISASGASEHPNAFRRAWKYFTTYNLDEDESLTELQVVDMGDVRQHVTDISVCHTNIRKAMVAFQDHHPQLFPLFVGGDHSITAMLVKGYKDVYPEQRIGILQFDTHFDLRDLKDDGPSNGTPIRNLIESETIKGEDVYNIGLHGFFNAYSLKEYADHHKVNYITMRQARQKGITKVVKEALTELSKKVDTIYVTVDMDVLDQSVGPGAPASTPGGMATDELFQAVYTAGRNPKVKAMDIVCLDPLKDVGEHTVKVGVHTMLSFLTGYKQRLKRGKEKR